MNKDQINRLGFDAWADNEFVNAIENFPQIATGDMTIENEGMTMKLVFTETHVSCVIRAYTQDGGWQTYEREIKR
jgi:hypothetical protein